jgi:predicted ATPase/DNA-binding SARP family transcriptional activator
MMISEKWRITLLNGLELTGNGQRVDRFRSRTTAELLALLVLKSHRIVVREEIAGTIWPDSTPEAGRAGLRTALASLRAQLELPGTIANTILLADRVGVRLSTDAFTSDVLEFKAYSTLALSAATPESRLETALTAVDHYAGELLPGIFSEWVLAEREKLHRSYLSHVSEIVAFYRSTGQFSLAIPYAQRLVDEDPFDEDACVLMMRLCIEAGRPDDAIIGFDRLNRTLHTELETSPGAAASELQKFARQMCAETPAPSTQQSSAASVVSLGRNESSRFQPFGQNSNKDAGSISRPTGLPIPLTRFFGRDTDIMHIVGMICPNTASGISNPQRLITLSGTGGTGKTRLAIEIGSVLHSGRQISVTFVPLADISDPARILEAIATALEIAAIEADNLTAGIVSTLSGKPHLLILDNLEQLLGNESEPDDGREAPHSSLAQATTEIILSLLMYLPDLCCLITSRQTLSVDGEQEYPLQPLSTPTLPATPERLLDFASVKLFLDRAQLSRPDFQLTSRNSEVVASICARLDGLPLALELAAAWSSSLSPAQILERLAHRFDFLVGRKRGRAARHASLRAAIEWSFQLLTSAQRNMFSRLSVFRGGWTAEAAAYVCEDSEALETLSSLLNRSLIVMDEAQDNSEDLLRYRLLESLREYSAEQLSDQDTSAAKRRHLLWFAMWSNEANSSWSGTEQQRWLQRVHLEQENIRAAIQFSVNDEDPSSVTIGMEIMVNLGQYWSLRGNLNDARATFTQFIEHPGTQEGDVWRARALVIAGGLAGFQEEWGVAAEMFEESLAIAWNCNPLMVGTAQIKLGDVALVSGDLMNANRHYRDALTSYESAGSVVGVAAAYGALGQIAMNENAFGSAIPLVLKAVELNRHNHNLSGVTHHLKQLGVCYSAAGHQEEARDCFAESLNGYVALRDLRGIAELFSEIAEVFPISEYSVCLLGAARTINLAVSARPKENQELITRCRTALGTSTFDEAWERGMNLSTVQAVELSERVLTADRAGVVSR